MWESYKTGIMRNPGLVSPPLWLENYNPAYVKQMQISPCLFSITIFAQILSLFYWLTCWKNRFVKFYVGSCCDLRQHECKPHNRGLNNKCYDDCMCEEGEGFFLYCSITGCNSFKHFTFCNHFFNVLSLFQDFVVMPSSIVSDVWPGERVGVWCQSRST